MIITAIPHYDNFLGNGYYLVSECMDKTWYKGETPEDAVNNFLQEHKYLRADDIKILEKE